MNLNFKFFRIRWIILFIMASQLIFGCDKKHEKPNIVIILADDAGYADFGFMGSNDLETPNLDALAKEGVIFTDAHTSATVCSPSRAGLITGRYQNRFGHTCNIPPHNLGMDPKEKTLADVLKTAGYKTAAIGKWHLGELDEYHPNNRGFDEFYGFLDGHRSYFFNDKEDVDGHSHAILHNKNRVDFDAYLTDVFGEKAVEFIEQSKNDPFFLYLAYNAVHTPLQATKEDLEKFKGHPRQKLAAMTWALDRSIGKVLSKLKEEKLDDNTLIFFLSDNGGADNNQSSCLPLKGYKGNKFEGGHRVPFVLKWKNKISPGRSYHKLTSSLDIFATAISAAGIQETNGGDLDGIDLLPYISGKNNNPPHRQLFWSRDIMAAMRLDSFKLVEVKDYGYRLYNLESNLDETIDTKNIYPDVFEEMKTDLKDWEQQMPKPWWNEPRVWVEVNHYIFRDLMENRKPQVTSPKELQLLRESGKIK